MNCYPVFYICRRFSQNRCRTFSQNCVTWFYVSPQWLKFGIRDMQAMLLSTYEFHEIGLMEGHIFLVSLNDNCDL